MARYDFRRPNNLNRDHTRALQIASEGFARQWTTILSMSLRAVSLVTVTKIEQRTYDEYVQSLPNPAYLGILTLAPLSGTSLLHLPLRVVMATVDRLVGGPGGPRQPSRAVTEIEGNILRTHLKRVLVELANGFAPLVQTEPVLVGHEANPQFAQVAAPSDMVVVIDLQIRIGDVESTGSLCIPFSALVPVFEARDREHRAALPDDVGGLRLTLEERMDEVPIEVSLRFGDVTLTAAELAGLRPGDLLDVHHRTDAPLAVVVGGVPRFQARLGRRHNRLAAQLLDVSELRHPARAP